MRVLVGTRAGLVEVPGGRTVAFAGRDVRALSRQGWVILDGSEVCALNGRPASSADGAGELTCIDGDPDPWVGTAGAHLLRIGATPHPVDAFERVEGRHEWYTPWGGPPDVRSLSVGSHGTVLVNVHVGGILRSDDEGASWRPTIDLHHDVHQVELVDEEQAVAACAHGLALSTDGGSTWSLHDRGLHARYCRAVAVSGEMVLLSASTGPRGDRGAVYRRPLSGADAPFERCTAGLPEWLEGNVDTFWLAGGREGGAAFATGTGDVYVSADQGATWERAATGLPPVRCVTLG